MSAEPIGKMPFPGVACPRDAKSTPTGAAGNPVGQNWPWDLATERRSGVCGSYNWRFKTEIPAS
jgi:hypothetical protein